MANESQRIKTCFVAAPEGVSLDVLRDSLRAHNIRPLVPTDLFTGNDWASETQRQMLEADLVVGILPAASQSSWVLFELGQAWALGRRILMIAAPEVPAIPSDLQRVLVLRTAPNNREAIDFALDQLSAAPADKPRSVALRSFHYDSHARQTDSLVGRLDRTLAGSDAKAFEKLVAEIMRRSGVDVVVESPNPDRGADLAVWSDALQPFVGNPILVEAKMRIRDQASAESALEQLDSYLKSSAASYALLIVGEGPPPNENIWIKAPPNILILEARSLLNELSSRSFAEVVRDLRNRRVHSVAT